MLVAIPYYSGDEAQALRLADWLRELGPYRGHSLLIERDARCPTRQVFDKMSLAGFDKIEEIVNPFGIDGWPQGGNSVFQFAARYISYACPQPWLFLEPDAVPMYRGWLDKMEREYSESGKDFLGDFVSIHTPEMDVPDHMSGVGIYPPDLITCKTPQAGEGLICSYLAWDVVIGQYILPNNVHNSKFLLHAWKHPAFQDWEQVEREILAFKPDCHLFHASKDGSLILRLQEQRAREAGGIGELSGEESKPEAVRSDAYGAPDSSSGNGSSTSPSQPTTDILIKTYPKDYEWLSYCLRGLEKFASGFRKIIVVYPINEAGPTLPLTNAIPIHFLPVQERGEAYLWQQVVKFNAHECTDATYVLHIDSDTVATAPFTPGTFIRDGKPLWLMTPYAGIQTPWQPITEKFLGEKVEFEFMRRFPMFIPRALHVAASKFVQIRHNMSAADYIMSQPARDFSEFNALGALAYSRARDDFRWLDTTKEELPELVAIQSWSHGGLSDQLRGKFENILSGSGAMLSKSSQGGSQPNTKNQAGVASPAQSLLVGGGFAHAAGTSPVVPAADQTLYEKEKEPVCDGGGRATGDLGEVRITGDKRRSPDRTNINGDGITAQNAQRDDVGGVPPSNQTLTSEAGRTSQQTNQGIHQTKEGWWVIDGDTHISKWVEDEGRLDHDQWLLPKILPEINEGDVVVDAGAFIGDHAIAYAKAVGDHGQLWCFEPNPLAAECCRRNISKAATSHMRIYKVALSSEKVAYPFEILPNAGASTIAPRSKINVQAITLDSLKLQRLNFFKIDVEGHELQVLKGAEETITRCRPKLLIEINKWPLTRQGVESRQIFDWLKSHGYKWSSVQPMHVADPPHYDILCRLVAKEANTKKVVPWANQLESKEEIRGLISRLRDFTAGATPSQIRFVRQELVVHDVTRRPKDYNWVVIRKKRNAMKRRLAKGIKDE